MSSDHGVHSIECHGFFAGRDQPNARSCLARDVDYGVLNCSIGRQRFHHSIE